MNIAHSFMAYLWDFDSILYRVCPRENKNWGFFDNLNETSYLHLHLSNLKKKKYTTQLHIFKRQTIYAICFLFNNQPQFKNLVKFNIDKTVHPRVIQAFVSHSHLLYSCMGSSRNVCSNQLYYARDNLNTTVIIYAILPALTLKNSAFCLHSVFRVNPWISSKVGTEFFSHRVTQKSIDKFN